MGTLRKYDLQHTKCQVFFETGTGLGHSLKHALDNGNFSTLIALKFMRQPLNAPARFLRRIRRCISFTPIPPLR